MDPGRRHADLDHVPVVPGFQQAGWASTYTRGAVPKEPLRLGERRYYAFLPEIPEAQTAV